MKEQNSEEITKHRGQYRNNLLMEACSYGTSIISALNIHNKGDINYWHLLETGLIVSAFFGYGQFCGMRRRYRASRIKSLQEESSESENERREN